MERLLFAFVFIGTTLACSPVPEPKVKGKGHDVVYVTLVTNQTYNPAGINTFLSDFSKTEIQQYSASVGNFSDLNCTNTDGYFTWTFKLTDANCSIVNAWVKQIVASSSFYKAGYTSCGSETFTAYVTLVTYTRWQPAIKSIELSLFNLTNAQPYSASLGNFTDLHVINVNGFLAYAFTFTNANCSNVEHWVRLTVAGNSEIKAFTNGTVTCGPAETPTSGNQNLIEITTPPATTTTATPLVILPGGALPVASVIIPYQSDHEETAEHVEESVSSFESMSITSL